MSFFAPFVFASHLLFLLLGEIVLDVKVLSDLFRGLALDHFSDRLAGKVEPEFRMERKRRKIKKKFSLEYIYFLLVRGQFAEKRETQTPPVGTPAPPPMTSLQIKEKCSYILLMSRKFAAKIISNNVA